MRDFFNGLSNFLDSDAVIYGIIFIYLGFKIDYMEKEIKKLKNK